MSAKSRQNKHTELFFQWISVWFWSFASWRPFGSGRCDSKQGCDEQGRCNYTNSNHWIDAVNCEHSTIALSLLTVNNWRGT
jgi:hypothetical protein